MIVAGAANLFRKSFILADFVSGIADCLGRGPGGRNIGQEVVGVVAERGSGGAAALRIGDGLLERPEPDHPEPVEGATGTRW